MIHLVNRCPRIVHAYFISTRPCGVSDVGVHGLRPTVPTVTGETTITTTTWFAWWLVGPVGLTEVERPEAKGAVFLRP